MTNSIQPNRPELAKPFIEEIVKAALLEDLGRAGDITSQATIPADATATAVLNAREDGVIAGLPLAKAAFEMMDPSLTVTFDFKDGDRIKAGQNIGVISGNARAVLSAERVALNYLMHLSGIASYTALFADSIAHTKAKVTCTRKTIPGLRALEKYAVRCGGAVNHRFGLDDAILIKDNHIAVCGSVAQAVRTAKAFAGHLVKVEVEVTTLDELREALVEKPDVILLDNMGPDLLREAVAINAGQAVLEASGGIAFDTIVAVAETGIDRISTSKITMSAPSLDIGLDIKIS